MIDVHAHVGVPQAALTASRASGFAAHQAAMRARYQNPLTAEYMRSVAGGWDRLLTDLGARLQRMDDTGVTGQLISVNPGRTTGRIATRPASSSARSMSISLMLPPPGLTGSWGWELSPSSILSWPRCNYARPWHISASLASRFYSRRRPRPVGAGVRPAVGRRRRARRSGVHSPAGLSATH